MRLYIQLSRWHDCMLISSDAICWPILGGARVSRSTKIKMGMPSSLIVRVAGCTDITWNGPRARVNSLLTVTFAIAFVECADAAKRGGRSSITISLVVIVGVSHTSMSSSRLYCCRLARMCVSARDQKIRMRASNACRVAWTDVSPENQYDVPILQKVALVPIGTRL